MNVYFILHYHLFFRKSLFSNIFKWIWYPHVFICFLVEKYFIHWIRTQLGEWRGKVMQNVCRCIEGKRSITPHVHVRTYIYTNLFPWFCHMVPCFICRNLTLPSSKKGVFLRNGYFSYMRSISVVIKKVFSNFKLFFRTKVSKKAFSFNQIESSVYSIF